MSEEDCLKRQPLPEQWIYGTIMLCCALLAFLFYSFLLESIFIFARRRVAVMLLLSHSFAELFMLIQFVWLSLEMITNRRVWLPCHLDSFLYKFANNAEQAHLLLIALNRAHCIYSPNHYKKLWSQRNAVFFCAFAWSYGLAISVVLNYVLGKPEEAYLIHCIARFTFDRIRTNTTEEMAHELLGRYSTILLVFLPLAIYGIFLVQIACEWLCPRVTELAILMHQRSRKFTRGAKLSDEVGSLGDRIRLLMICLLSTLPDAVVWLTMAAVGKEEPYKKFMQSMLIIAMHCNQPIWLILLSATFRVHLRREIGDFLDAIQSPFYWLFYGTANEDNNNNNNEANGHTQQQNGNGQKHGGFLKSRPPSTGSRGKGRRMGRKYEDQQNGGTTILESKCGGESRRGSGPIHSVFTLLGNEQMTPAANDSNANNNIDNDNDNAKGRNVTKDDNGMDYYKGNGHDAIIERAEKDKWKKVEKF